MRMGGITHTKIEAISWREFVEVILASTETSVKLTVPFKEETCYTRLQVGDFSAGSTPIFTPVTGRRDADAAVTFTAVCAGY